MLQGSDLSHYDRFLCSELKCCKGLLGLILDVHDDLFLNFSTGCAMLVLNGREQLVKVGT